MVKKIEWLGTLTSVAGSFILAMQFALAGYSLFLVGSVSWLAVGIARKNSALITLNGAFFVANIIGFYNVVFHN